MARIFIIVIYVCFGSTISIAAPDQAMVDKGRACLNDLASCNVGSDLDDIIAIMHFLYDIGLSKNDGKDFKSGTFVVEDPGFHILSELKKYVESDFGKNLCHEVTFTFKDAYPRKSTHFNALYIYRGQAKKAIFGGVKKTDCDFVSFGIDAPKDRLPMEGKNHILFGKIGVIDGRELIYIKLEESGLHGLDVLTHTINLIKVNVKKMLPILIKDIKNKLDLKKVSENVIAKEFKDLFDETSADSNLYQNRRERIPAELMAYYLFLLLEKGNGKKTAGFNEGKELAKAFGIQAMVKNLEKVLSHGVGLDEKTIKDTQSFLKLVKAQYPEDYFMRFGNEVIIRPQDWVSNIANGSI